MFKKILQILKQLKLYDLAFSKRVCPLCEGRWLIKLSNDEMGVHCLACQGSAVAQSMATVFKQREQLYARIIAERAKHAKKKGLWTQGTRC